MREVSFLIAMLPLPENERLREAIDLFFKNGQFDLTDPDIYKNLLKFIEGTVDPLADPYAKVVLSALGSGRSEIREAAERLIDLEQVKTDETLFTKYYLSVFEKGKESDIERALSDILSSDRDLKFMQGVLTERAKIEKRTSSLSLLFLIFEKQEWKTNDIFNFEVAIEDQEVLNRLTYYQQNKQAYSSQFKAFLQKSLRYSNQSIVKQALEQIPDEKIEDFQAEFDLLLKNSDWRIRQASLERLYRSTREIPSKTLKTVYSITKEPDYSTLKSWLKLVLKNPSGLSNEIVYNVVKMLNGRLTGVDIDELLSRLNFHKVGIDSKLEELLVDQFLFSQDSKHQKFAREWLSKNRERFIFLIQKDLPLKDISTFKSRQLRFFVEVLHDLELMQTEIFKSVLMASFKSESSEAPRAALKLMPSHFFLKYDHLVLDLVKRNLVGEVFLKRIEQVNWEKSPYLRKALLNLYLGASSSFKEKAENLLIKSDYHKSVLFQKELVQAQFLSSNSEVKLQGLDRLLSNTELLKSSDIEASLVHLCSDGSDRVRTKAWSVVNESNLQNSNLLSRLNLSEDQPKKDIQRTLKGLGNIDWSNQSLTRSKVIEYLKSNDSSFIVSALVSLQETPWFQDDEVKEIVIGHLTRSDETINAQALKIILSQEWYKDQRIIKKVSQLILDGHKSVKKIVFEGLASLDDIPWKGYIVNLIQALETSDTKSLEWIFSALLRTNQSVLKSFKTELLSILKDKKGDQAFRVVVDGLNEFKFISDSDIYNQVIKLQLEGKVIQHRLRYISETEWIHRDKTPGLLKKGINDGMSSTRLMSYQGVMKSRAFSNKNKISIFKKGLVDLDEDVSGFCRKQLGPEVYSSHVKTSQYLNDVLNSKRSDLKQEILSGLTLEVYQKNSLEKVMLKFIQEGKTEEVVEALEALRRLGVENSIDQNTVEKLRQSLIPQIRDKIDEVYGKIEVKGLPKSYVGYMHLRKCFSKGKNGQGMGIEELQLD